MISDNKKAYISGYLDALKEQIGVDTLLKNWNKLFDEAETAFSQWERNELEIEMRSIREKIARIKEENCGSCVHSMEICDDSLVICQCTNRSKKTDEECDIDNYELNLKRPLSHNNTH